MSRLGVTPTLWNRVMESGECHYCRFPASEVDHVVPVSRGGHNDPENLVPACFECNHEKLALTVDEWENKRRAAGKPWPVPDAVDRIKFLVSYGIRPWGRMAEFRQLMVDARDVDIAQLLVGGAA